MKYINRQSFNRHLSCCFSSDLTALEKLVLTQKIIRDDSDLISVKQRMPTNVKPAIHGEIVNLFDNIHSSNLSTNGEREIVYVLAGKKTCKPIKDLCKNKRLMQIMKNFLIPLVFAFRANEDFPRDVAGWVRFGVPLGLGLIACVFSKRLQKKQNEMFFKVDHSFISLEDHITNKDSDLKSIFKFSGELNLAEEGGVDFFKLEDRAAEIQTADPLGFIRLSDILTIAVCVASFYFTYGSDDDSNGFTIRDVLLAAIVIFNLLTPKPQPCLKGSSFLPCASTGRHYISKDGIAQRSLLYDSSPTTATDFDQKLNTFAADSRRSESFKDALQALNAQPSTSSSSLSPDGSPA